MEKAKERCVDSPTLNEKWVKKILGEVVCENSCYSETIVRNRVEKFLIFNEYLKISNKDDNKISIPFIGSDLG